jgi:alkylation response protein AidB-like acyl-CoA dehydrogenase
MTISESGAAEAGPVADESIRAEVRAWLADHWRPGLEPEDWVETVVDAGWAVPTWPAQWYGRDLSGDQAVVVAEEFERVGAPGSRQDLHNLWANTMLAFGTEELKAKFVRPLLLGRVGMCLLYSEPGAGSDLAGLQTRAERDGDEWVVNGQKVWTSGAREADYGMLVARTDWDVPKHRGITFFWFPMKQAGVEIRPIKQITGEAHFNEVFIDNARVPDTHVLGGLNNGWRVLQTALAYERSVMGDVARGPRGATGAEGEGDGEGGDPSAKAVGAVDVDLIGLARAFGRSQEPAVRDAIARVYTLRAVNRWNAARAKAQLEQGSSSPILSLGKLAMSRILHEGAYVQAMIVGPEAMLYGPNHPAGDAAGFLTLNAYFTSIGGGTDQIQRNIIGERVLGLPREPEVDRTMAFKDVVKASVTPRQR